MKKLISGIHHVTALAGEPQHNLDFYSGILGLRLVKKTVNFDAPDIYHFYYGDELGNPGTIMTFFPYIGIPSGRQGKGMVNVTSFSVPASSISYWENRLKHHRIEFTPASDRFDQEAVISFKDPDGLPLELVFNDFDSREAHSQGTVPQEHAIKGFYNIEIWQDGYERTAKLLTECLDHSLISEKGNRYRFASSDLPGNFVDIVCKPDSLKGLGGGGTVHHIAFSTPDPGTQKAVRSKLLENGTNPTPPLDRQYFNSIYFREPGGVLFEVATVTPGFTVDEEKEALGQKLMLPPQFEPQRHLIEKNLKPVEFNPQKFK